MTLIVIFLYIEACCLGSPPPPPPTKLKRCAKKMNMSQSQYLIRFLILPSVVWIKVLKICLKMTLILNFLHIEACMLGSPPSNT